MIDTLFSFYLFFDDLIHFFNELFPFFGGFYFLLFIAEVCPFGNFLAPFFKLILCRAAVRVYVLFGNRIVSVNHIIHNAFVF